MSTASIELDQDQVPSSDELRLGNGALCKTLYFEGDPTKPYWGFKVMPLDGRKLMGSILEVHQPEIPQWQIDKAVNKPDSNKGVAYAWVRWDDDPPTMRRLFPLRDLRSIPALAGAKFDIDGYE